MSLAETIAMLTQAIRQRGRRCLHQGDYAQAANLFTAALKLDPANAPLYADRGEAYRLLGDCERALADFQVALQSDAAAPTLLIQRAVAYHLHGEHDLALADCQAFLARQPGGTAAEPASPIAVIKTEPTVGERAARTAPPKANGTSAPSSSKPKKPATALRQTNGAVPRPQPDDRPPAPPIAPANAPAAAAKAAPPEPASLELAPAAATPVECPICRRAGVPAETLSGGRFRCGSCQCAFLPASGGKPPVNANPARPPAPKPAPNAADDDAEPGFLKKWHRPATVAGASTAALLLLWFFLPLHFLQGSGRAAVFAASGKAEFEEQPIANASVVLHPVWIKNPPFPRPRGTVQEDGTFVLGTYGQDDGAPAGEYKVTVQWFKKAAITDRDGGPLQKSMVPAKYGAAETSGLTVRIQPGQNQIPTLKLKR